MTADEYATEAAVMSAGVPVLEETVREDYEFYTLTEDGVVKIVASYSCHCSVCQLNLDFTDKHPLFLLNRPEGE